MSNTTLTTTTLDQEAIEAIVLNFVNAASPPPLGVVTRFSLVNGAGRVAENISATITQEDTTLQTMLASIRSSEFNAPKKLTSNDTPPIEGTTLADFVHDTTREEGDVTEGDVPSVPKYNQTEMYTTDDANEIDQF